MANQNDTRYSAFVVIAHIRLCDEMGPQSTPAEATQWAHDALKARLCPKCNLVSVEAFPASEAWEKIVVRNEKKEE